MALSIFISHSAKDNERQPPAGLTQTEIDERQARLTFARKLRHDVHTRLATDARFDPFLDVRGGLQPGDPWMDGLHKALRGASGAVILLSPEALESDWVLKEASILLWRVALGDPLKVVPVLLGVSNSDLREQGFGAAGIDAIQRVEVPEATDQERQKATTKIVDAFDTLPDLVGARTDSRWTTDVEKWIEEFAEKLKEAVPEDLEHRYLPEMDDALAIDTTVAGALDRFEADRYMNIATQTLAASSAEVLAVVEAAGDPPESLRMTLASKTEALWVEGAAAGGLPMAASGGNVVVIDGKEQRSGRDYINRAYCGGNRDDRILEPGDVTSGTVVQVVAKVERFMGKYWPIENDDEMRQDIDTRGLPFVVLGPGMARHDVLDALTEKHPRVCFVALAGSEPVKRLGAWVDNSTLLRPLLQPSREKAGRRFRNSLRAYVTGRTEEDDDG